MRIKLWSASKTNIRRSKIVISWLLSYAIVLIIPVLCNVFIYQKASGTIKEELYQSNDRMLTTLQSNMDDTLSAISTLAMNISLNSNFKDILAQTEDSAQTRFLLTNFASELRSYRVYNSNISDIYLFFNNLNIGVGGNFYASAKPFYDYYYPNGGINYSDWYHEMHSENYLSYHLVKNTAGDAAIDFIFQMPLYSTSDIAASIVVRVDEAVLHGIVQRHGEFDNTSLYMLDSADQVIMSYGTAGIAQQAYQSYNGTNGQMQGKNAITIYQTSPVTRWKYISIIPHSIINDRLRFMWLFNFINILICIIIGSFLGYYFTLKNYRPIDRLAQFCENALSMSNTHGEMDMIDQMLQDYIDIRQEYKSIKNEQALSHRTQLLASLCKGTASDKSILQEELQRYGITFISPYFAVLLFKITGYERLFANDETVDDQNRADMLNFIMRNVTEELIGKYHRGYLAEIDGQLVCLINFNELRMAELQEDVREAVSKEKSFIEENFEFSFISCMSAVHQGIPGIAAAYTEARQTLRFRTQLSQNDIIFYDLFNNTESHMSSKHFLTLEKERQLINLINLGDCKTATKVIDALIDQQLQSSAIDTTRIFIFDLVSAILKSVSEEGGAEKIDAEYSKISAETSAVLNFDTLQEFQRNLHALLDTVCTIKQRCLAKKEENKQTADANEDLVTNIKAYIDKNYTNKMLNIASIGDYFNITPYYASNMFKKAEGISMLDYIGSLRVSVAKEIMQNDHSSMEVIAQQVGFSNVRTFMRAFSKYEGVTPGKYKELLDAKKYFE